MHTIRLEQHTLGAGNLSLSSNDRCTSHSKRDSQCLKSTLRPVVVIVSSYTIHVHCDTRSLRKRLQTMWQHLTAQIPNLFSFGTKVDDGEWAVRKIDNRSGKCFVKWAVCMAESCEACRSVKCLFEGLNDLAEVLLILASLPVLVQCMNPLRCGGRRCEDLPSFSNASSNLHAWPEHGACGPESQCLYLH